MQPVTYHLTAIETWLTQAQGLTYLPEKFSADGFIHCTDGVDQVLAAGNRYCSADLRPYCLLTIETGLLTSSVRYDDERQIFPHIYGPLNVDAVTAVHRALRASDGTFTGVGEAVTGP